MIGIHIPYIPFWKKLLWLENVIAQIFQRLNSFISILEAENVVRIREEAFNQELIKLQTELENQKRLQVEQLQKMSEGKSNKTTVTEKCIVQWYE